MAFVCNVAPIISIVLDKIAQGHFAVWPNIVIVQIGVEHNDAEGEQVGGITGLLFVLRKEFQSS
eukprot:scaffold141835_cov20-Attheya_sp.AAC.1